MAPTSTHTIDGDAGRRPSRVRVATVALALFALAFALALPGNGARRPLSAHEAFVARTVVEMERRGDHMVPYFNSGQRLQKPPLSYWLVMLAERVCGDGSVSPQNEFSARLPSIVLGAGTAVLTAFLGWIVFDSALIGVLGALFFATNSFYVEWARSAQPEMAYTFFCALFLLAAAWARRAALAGRGTWRAALCAWAAVALAILVKGPIIPVLLLAGAAIAMRKRAGGPGFLRTLHVPAGLAWMLILVLPWFAVVVDRMPGAIEYWRAQMFDRTGGLGTAWWKPLEFFYVGQALGTWMPWSALLAFVPIWFWRTRSAERHSELDAPSNGRWRGARFLGWCALVPAIALSFSAGRKGYYLLPMFPAMGLLMAWAGVSAFERAREHASAPRKLERALQAHALLFTALAIGLIVMVTLRRRWLGFDDGMFFGVTAVLAVALTLACLGFGMAGRRPRSSVVLLVSSAFFSALAVGASGVNSRVRLYTDGRFAREVARVTDSTRPMLVVDGDSQVLLYYTDRPVRQIRAQELPSELAATPAPWIVDHESNRPGGRVIVREQRPAGEDPMLLVDPTLAPEPASSSEGLRGTR